MNTTKLKTRPWMLTILVTTIMSLTACGGGGGQATQNSNQNNTDPNTHGQTSTNTPNPSATNQGSGNTNGQTSNGSNSGSNSSTPPENTQPVLPKYPANHTPEQVALDHLNQRRQQCDFDKLSVNPELEKAATNHAKYLAYVTENIKLPFVSHHEKVQHSNKVANIDKFTGTNNPYFSGEGYVNRVNVKTPYGSRALPVNYPYQTVTENINTRTHTNSLKRLEYSLADKQQFAKLSVNNLLAAPYHLRNLVSLSFTEIGIKYHDVSYPSRMKYKDNGKLRELDGFSTTAYLEMVSGRPQSMGEAPKNRNLYTYPCHGVQDTEYQLTHEEPNPFGDSRDLEKNPIGQPVYVLAPHDKVIHKASADITLNGKSVGEIHVLKYDKNPKSSPPLTKNEVFFMPDKPLLPNSTYQVSFRLEYQDGTSDSKQFSFSTRAKTQSEVNNK